MITLHARPLTAEAFRPFGDVVEEPAADGDARPDRRFDDLAGLDAGEDGVPMLSLLRMRSTIALPFRPAKLERHPLGSQAFVPCAPLPFLVLVASGGDRPDLATLTAFLTDGRQGVNYRKGVWHGPMSPLVAGTLVVVDRKGPGVNTEFFHLDEHPVTVLPAV